MNWRVECYEFRVWSSFKSMVGLSAVNSFYNKVCISSHFYSCSCSLFIFTNFQIQPTYLHPTLLEILLPLFTIKKQSRLLRRPRRLRRPLRTLRPSRRRNRIPNLLQYTRHRYSQTRASRPLSFVR